MPTPIQVTKSPDTNDAPATSVVTAAFASALTAGNTVTGHVSFQNGGLGGTELTSVTDSAGNTYTIIDRQEIAGTGLYLATFVKANVAAGAAPTVTANFSVAVAFRRIAAQEFSGLATTGQPNNHKSNASATFGTGTDAVTSTAATTTATCTVVGVAYDDSTATIPAVGTGFTSLDTGSFGAGDAFRVEYKTGVAAGSVAATFTTTAGTDAIGVAMLALEEAAAGGGFKPAYAVNANAPFVWRGDMFKNTAGQVIGAQMIDATTGAAFTGAVSVSVTKDGAAQAAGGGSAPVHEGNGFHTYVPTQAETNGDHVAFTFTGTGAIPVTIQVYTADKAAMDALNAAAKVIGFCTIGSGATTTSIPLSAINIGGLTSVGADALAGSMFEVRGDTPTTTALGGKKVTIASNTAGATPTLTLATALPTAPASGDLGVVG